MATTVIIGSVDIVGFHQRPVLFASVKPILANIQIAIASARRARRYMNRPQEYVVLLKSVFDFPRLKTLVARPDFNFVFDGMHGVAGPYATRVFVDELGAPEESLLRWAGKNEQAQTTVSFARRRRSHLFAHTSMRVVFVCFCAMDMRPFFRLRAATVVALGIPVE